MKTENLAAVQAKALSLGTSCLGIARLPRGHYALRVVEAAYVGVMAKMSADDTSTMKTGFIPKLTYLLSGFPMTYTLEDQEAHLQDWGWQVKILKSHSLVSQGYRTSIAVSAGPPPELYSSHKGIEIIIMAKPRGNQVTVPTKPGSSGSSFYGNFVTGQWHQVLWSARHKELQELRAPVQSYHRVLLATCLRSQANHR